MRLELSLVAIVATLINSHPRKRWTQQGLCCVLSGTARLAALLSVVLAFVGSPVYSADLILNNAPTKVFFSPRGGCTEAIVSEIQAARSQILLQAYSFTSAPLAKALISAHKRGVHVQAIVDQSQASESYTSATFLANSGIPTYIDWKHGIAHNKVLIIDRALVVTGSFNFTKAAEEKNAENVIIIRSEELAKLYEANWHKHREHSEVYQARY
jgi:phosphatidylserine/phosphatidylglycerophosphate/cardiolipin synthase-like enzyme